MKTQKATREGSPEGIRLLNAYWDAAFKHGQFIQKEKDIKIVKEESNSRLDCIRRIQGGKE